MILLTDGMFPSKYAKWRIEETKAFIDSGCDILVNKVTSYGGIDYNVDYEEMKDYYNLSEYNILIFDPEYNYLDKYNTRLDGTQFNGTVTGYSYLFTKLNEFNIRNYETVFHIFLSAYIKFNNTFNVNQDKQVIHLYPGGTFNILDDIAKINPAVRIVSTQPKVTAMVRNYKHIECLGSTCLPQNHVPKAKEKNTDKPLQVCFSNMGNAAAKGVDTFMGVVGLCNISNVEWHYIGSTYGLRNKKDNIIFHPPMAQSELDVFYNENIDVLINAENGALFNGWPLGIEAALQGVVLVTTDTHQSNRAFKYGNNSLFIVTPNNAVSIARYIKQLEKDRELLHTMSQNIQAHSCKVFSYENQQERILKFTNE